MNIADHVPLATLSDEQTENSCPFRDDEQCCDLCQEIIDTSKTEWVFEWIRKLSDWEKTLHYEDKCQQLSFNLVQEGMVDKGNRIRDKLGILQTEMVNFVD